jgi:flagellar biosynthesis/type III secretory pathway protein FliH
MFNENDTQATYSETPYADETWEIVGEPPASEEFVPMEVQIIRNGEPLVNVMFEDFGGTSDPRLSQRYHLAANEFYTPTYNEDKDLEEIERQRQAKFEEQIAEAKKLAYEEGRQVALLEAIQVQSERLEQIESKVRLVFEDLDSQLKDNLDQIERKAIELSLQISRKVIDTAVEINPEYIIPILHKALELGSSGNIKIVRVSPQDLEFIELVGLKKTLCESTDTWEFKADSSIKAGCILESDAGEVDFNLDQIWNRIADQVVSIIK